MPKVGNKKFPYTAKGMRDAKLAAKGMGKKVHENREAGSMSWRGKSGKKGRR